MRRKCLHWGRKRGLIVGTISQKICKVRKKKKKSGGERKKKIYPTKLMMIIVCERIGNVSAQSQSGTNADVSVRETGARAVVIHLGLMLAFWTGNAPHLSVLKSVPLIISCGWVLIVLNEYWFRFGAVACMNRYKISADQPNTAVVDVKMCLCCASSGAVSLQSTFLNEGQGHRAAVFLCRGFFQWKNHSRPWFSCANKKRNSVKRIYVGKREKITGMRHDFCWRTFFRKLVVFITEHRSITQNRWSIRRKLNGMKNSPGLIYCFFRFLTSFN